jgi:hypothetical protein
VVGGEVEESVRVVAASGPETGIGGEGDDDIII